MNVLLNLILLIWVQMNVGILAQQCSNTDSGCPVSTSPANIEECRGLDQFLTVSYCGGYALCLQDGVGIRYRCPAGTQPGPRCVPESTEGGAGGENDTAAAPACVPPCEDVVNGCPEEVANGTSDVTACPSTSGLFYIDNAEACGKFSMCIMGQVFSLYCPDGYRSDSTGSPKCVADYRCTEKTAPRLPICEDTSSGCAINDTVQYLDFCASQASDSYGLFDNPDECGTYYVCIGQGRGVKFECPLGYRTDITRTQFCVLDPGCPTPASARLVFNPSGCLDIINGCPVKNITLFPDCQRKPFRTPINDPTRCGYFERCTWGLGGYPAIEYMCPTGYRADASQTTQICVLDDHCASPESPRLTVTIKSSRVGREAPGCENIAFGCPRSVEAEYQESCLDVPKWKRIGSLSDCGQYLLCLAGEGEAIVIKCPPGHRARVASPPYCIPDPSCNTD